MLAVLDLDPVRRPPRTIRPIPELRHQPLQPHQTGMPEQVRADLALLEFGHEYAVDGRSDFNGLHSRKHDDEVQFYTFDMLAGDSQDLHKLPLSMRKINLARLARRVDTEQHGFAVDDEARIPSADIDQS
jgi:hypothetical protein